MRNDKAARQGRPATTTNQPRRSYRGLPIALQRAASGRPVFPLRPGGKQPHGQLVPHGKDEATTDVGRIREWWTAAPGANVGLRCDSWYVIDVDGPGGADSFKLLRDRFGLADTLAFPTARDGGGIRYAYALPTGTRIGQSTRQLGNPAGIHVRVGDKGYIVAPGCVHPTGRVYPPDNGAPVAPLPPLLVHVLEPPPPRPWTPPRTWVGTGDGTTYGLAALESETRELAATPHGGRHDRLYLAACRLGELEAGGELRTGVAEAALLDVLHRFPQPCGVDGGEKTIRDGLAKGAQAPRARRPRVLVLGSRNR